MKRTARFQWVALGVALLGACSSRVEPTPAVSERCVPYSVEPRFPFIPSAFPVEIVIDTRIDNQLVAVILDAIDLWNSHLGYEVLYATVTEDLYGMHGDCNFATVTTRPMLPRMDSLGLTTHGECAANHVDLLEDTTLTERELLTLAAHELGHVLGLPHEDFDSTSLMYPVLLSHEMSISERSTCLVLIYMAEAGIS